VVYDRGYFSYAMLYAHQQRGVDVIFRLARCSGKAIDAFMESDETDTIVTIEVAPARQSAVREQHPSTLIKTDPAMLKIIESPDAQIYTRTGL